MGWEGRFLLFLQDSVRNPVLDKIMQFITSLGDAGLIAIAACIILLCIRSCRQAGITASLSLILDFVVVNLVLKNLFARIRPYEVFLDLQLITHKPSDFSFPSGHAGACFAVASAIFLCMPKKAGIPALAVAALISFSRLYVGVHYPTDVLGGMLVGCVTGWAAWQLMKRRQKIT